MLLEPFNWLNNLFKRNNNILEWHLNFGKIFVGITTKSKNDPTDKLLIAALLLYIGRHFYICEENQEYLIRETFKNDVINQSNPADVALHLSEAAYSTLSAAEQQAFNEFFRVGPIPVGLPPFSFTENEEPENSIAKFSFHIFRQNNELFGNFFMSTFSPNLILLPITLGILYALVESKLAKRNKNALRNGILTLLEKQEEEGCRSVTLMRSQPLEVFNDLIIA